MHLKPLRELRRLEQWNDTRIRVGSKWREEIKTAVERASVTILLISADFLASDFIRNGRTFPSTESGRRESSENPPDYCEPMSVFQGAAFVSVSGRQRTETLVCGRGLSQRGPESAPYQKDMYGRLSAASV